MQAEDLELCGNSLERSSFLQVISMCFRIVKILQVEVEGFLTVKQLIVDRRFELPANLDADIYQSAIARLGRIADHHCVFGHLNYNGK